MPIICQVIDIRRRPRSDQPRKDKRQHFEQKRAHFAYHDVLARKPGIFLGFIIAISPNACRALKIHEFLAGCEHLEEQFLNDDIELTLENIAQAKGIDQSVQYRKLIKALRAKPTTVAENSRFGNRIYEAASWEGAQKAFGDKLCDAMVDGGQKPTRAPIKTFLPSQCQQDVLVELDIVQSNTLGMSLFPSFDASYSPTDGEGEMELSFQGASVGAFSSIFPLGICKAIDESELREWEKDHRLMAETNCVSMKLNHRQQHWKLRLRVGFFAFCLIINDLYS